MGTSAIFRPFKRDWMTISDAHSIPVVTSFISRTLSVRNALIPQWKSVVGMRNSFWPM